MNALPLKQKSVVRVNHRNRILLTACDLFLELGYDHTSLDAIVLRTGGSKSTIYHHFKNKKSLFITCIGHICDEFVENLNQVNINEKSFEDALRVLIEDFIRLIIEPRHLAFYRLVLAESANIPEVGQEWFNRGALLSRNTILKLIQRYTKDHVYEEAQLEQLAIMIFNTILSYLTIHAMVLGESGKDLPLKRITEELVALTILRLQSVNQASTTK